MTANVYFAGKPDSWDSYAPLLRDRLAAAKILATLSDKAPDPAEVDYIVCEPGGPLDDFTPFTGTKAVLGLWAGVEKIVTNTTLTQPLARMVDPGLKDGMVEWVMGHVLRHHLGLDADIRRKPGDWTTRVPPLARDRRVTVLGLGELGHAVARSLSDFGFDVAGWSRSRKSIDSVVCHWGADGLRPATAEADIIVLLMPLTPDTENTLNAATLSGLRKGVVILNPGRGALIDDDALLAALDRGQIGHATLDVFRREPLPEDHPYWTHPRVTITPHIASATRPETAADVIVENIRRGEAGEPFLHLVDRARGY